MPEITVNLDNATIGDMLLFERLQSGDFKMSELLEFLDRIIVSDTPLNNMPLTSLREIMAAVEAASGQLIAGDAEKN